MEPGVFLQLAQVEHIIKAVIIVGDDIEDHVSVVLESVHVMVGDHCSSVVLCLDRFARLSVYQVDQSLWKKQTFRKTVHGYVRNLDLESIPSLPGFLSVTLADSCTHSFPLVSTAASHFIL